MPSPWAVVRNSTQIRPEDPPPDMPSVWAVPEDQPKNLATPVADVRGPHGQLSDVTAQKANLSDIAMRNNEANDINRLAEVRYAQSHPWGTAENHPGKLGKLAHVFSEVGNIAGNIVAPNVMANIPQTQLGMKTEEARLTGRLNEEEKNKALEQEQGATTAHLNAETPEVAPNAASQRALQASTAHHQDVESNLAEHPLPEYSIDPRFVTEQGNPVTFEKHTGHFAPGDITGLYSPTGGNKLQAKPGIWNGQNVYGDYNPLDGQFYNPDTHQPMPGFQPFAPFSQVPNFQPYMFYNPATQGFGAGAFNVKSGGFAPFGPNAPRPVPTNVASEINRSLEDARGADTRFRVMSDSVPAALHGDQQAMLNILTNHIGMTLGLQKGARITQAIYDEAAQAAPWLQRVGAKFDDRGYLSGVTLAPEQIRQMVALGQDRRVRQWQQAADAARTYGMPIDDLIPKDLNNPSTVLNTPGNQIGGGNVPPPGAKIVKFGDIH